MGTMPSTQQLDVTPPWLKPVQQQAAGTTMSFLQNLANPGASLYSQLATNENGPLQNTATSQVGSLLGYNPESQALNSAAPALQSLVQSPALQFKQGENPYSTQSPLGMPNNLNNPFGGDAMQKTNQEFGQAQQGIQGALQGTGVNQNQMLQNPYGNLGFLNQAGAILNAYTPVWQQHLQSAQRGLNNSAGSPYSTAFAQQGNDLNQNALNDYNMFAQQTLMQGLQQQAAQQQANQNFALGAQGLYQQGAGQAANAQLQQAGLGLQGATQQSQAQQNILNQLGQFDLSQRNQNLNFAQGAQGLAQQREQNSANYDLASQQNFANQNLSARQLQQSGSLDAMNLLNQLAASAGQNPFTRALGAGTLGSSIYQNQFLNPTQQTLGEALQYGAPVGLQTITGQSAGQNIMSGLGGVLGLAGASTNPLGGLGKVLGKN